MDYSLDQERFLLFVLTVFIPNYLFRYLSKLTYLHCISLTSGLVRVYQYKDCLKPIYTDWGEKAEVVNNWRSTSG